MDKQLKVLMLNGSPRGQGNIALAFCEMEQVFTENDVTFENILLGRMDIRGCIACETCQYWNNIYGWEPGEGKVDDEGRQVMRVLARNMVFLMKSIVLGKEQIGLPKTEERVWTNFTR